MFSFSEEETGSERLSHIPKVTQLGKCHNGIRGPVCDHQADAERQGCLFCSGSLCPGSQGARSEHQKTSYNISPKSVGQRKEVSGWRGSPGESGLL